MQVLTNIKEKLQEWMQVYRGLERKWQITVIAVSCFLVFGVFSSLMGNLSTGVNNIAGSLAGSMGSNELKLDYYARDEMAEQEAMPSTVARSEMVAKKKAQMAYNGPAADVGLLDDKDLSQISGAASPPYGQAGEYFMPQIIKTANMSVTVENVVKAMSDLEHLTAANYGIITNKNLTVSQPQHGARYGNLVVRVPQDRLSLFLSEARKIGEVTNESQNGQDVGGEMVDLQSRIKNLKAEEKALQQIMNRTGKIPHILEVSRELSRVRGQIEQHQGRLNHLKQQVSYSTVNISLSEKYVAPASGKPTFMTVMENTFKQAGEGIYNVLVGVSQSAVWFVVFWIPLLAVWVAGLFVFILLLRLVWSGVCKVWASVPSDSSTKQNKTKTKKKTE